MMKKHIFMTILLSCLGMAAMAQTDAQKELKAYMDEGLVKWTIDDGKYAFRVGARVSLDAAHYIDDYTDRGSGVEFSEARIRIFSKIGRALDFKFDVDLAHKEAKLKDVYLRWHTNRNGFLRVGNFTEPFSAENIQSSYDDHFINKSATIEAFGTGRTLGISYRYYHPYFWGEGGVFSQSYDSDKGKGDMGYGLSTRLLARYQGSDFHVHGGVSLNYRRPNANGYTNGSDDYNRYVTITSPLESGVDRTPFLGSQIQNVKNTFKFGAEIMASYRFVYVTGEYLRTKIRRERDWDAMFASIQGSFMSTMAPTMDRMKSLYGGDPSIRLEGYTVQAGIKLLGGDYRYNGVDALMDRAGKGALELVLRWNHTDLNDIIDNSYYYNGKFYNSSMMASFGLANGSYSGGKVDTYTIGLNYYFSNNLFVKLNYGYQKLDHKYSMVYGFDEDLHSIHARLAFEF